MTLLKLPRLDLLTLSVSTELDLNAAGTQEGCGSAGSVLLGANFVTIHPPRLSKLVHVEFELVVSSHGVVSLLAVVVSTKST